MAILDPIERDRAAEIGHEMFMVGGSPRFGPHRWVCSCGYETTVASEMDAHLHAVRMLHAEERLDAAEAALRRIQHLNSATSGHGNDRANRRIADEALATR